MAYIRHQDAHDHFKDRVVEGLRQQFPVVGKRQTLRLDKLEVADRLHPDDIRDQYKAKVGGETWAVPIHATLSLVDNASQKVVETKRVKLAELPQITHRYSYIVDGQEYQIDNQWQLKPGVYARRRLNGELESRFNVTGRADFDLVFHPETKQFVMEYNTAKIPLYPIMKAMGVGDAALEHVWGKDILAANKASRRTSGALDQFAKTTKRGPDAFKGSEAHVQQVMSESKLDPDSTEMTLGKRFTSVDGDALTLATRKLLKVQAGQPQDDRDSLVFKSLRSVGDYAVDALHGARKDIRAKLERKLGGASVGVRDVVKSDIFNKPLREVFTKNSAARVATQINPAEMISASLQTTILGTYGGIKSEQSVTDEAKLINPSHFGYIDPINSPEGSSTGITLRLASGVRKVGSDPVIPLYNLKTGKMEDVAPREAIKATVVLADQVRWVGDKPQPLTSVVKMLGPNNEPTAGKMGDAHYVMRRPTHFLNITTNLIPFINNTNGARAAYASRHIEQAISLMHREAPLVQAATGVPGEVDTFDRLIGANVAAHRAPIAGVVKKVTHDGIVIDDGKGIEKEVQIYHNFPLNDPKSLLHSTPLVKVGDKVRAGQVVADTNYSRNGTLALGTNLRVGFLPYKGFNFEDGLVISEGAAKQLESQHMHKHELPIKEDTVLDTKKFLVQHPGAFTRDQLKHLGEDGVAKVGSKVRPGDPLVVAMRPFQLKDATGIQSIRKSLSGTHTDISMKWNSDHEGEVVGVHKAGDKVLVHVRTVEPMQVGDKMSTRGAGKGIVTLILPDKEMPHDKSGKPIDVIFNPCFDDKTEFLTGRGWVPGPALLDSDTFATVNQQTLMLEYQQPIEGVYRWKYEGKMYRLRNKQLDMMVTPNHRMFVAKRTPGVLGSLNLEECGSEFRLEEAQSVFGKARRYLKVARWKGESPDSITIPAGTQSVTGPRQKDLVLSTRDYAEFMGWYLAEGYVQARSNGSYIVCLCQCDEANPDKCALIKDLLTRMGVQYSYHPKEFVLCSKTMYEHLVGLGHAYEKYVPESIQALAPEYLRVFLDAYIAGNGNVRNRPSSGHHGTRRFDTTSAKLIEGVQLVAFKLGLVVNVGAPCVREGGKTGQHRPLYSGAVGMRCKAPWVNWSDETKETQVEEWVDYSGIVYCTEVPNGTLVVRRKGKIVVSGNCGLPGRMNLSQVLEVAAGKIAQKTGKTYVVDNFAPGSDDVLSKVKKELEHHGLSDTEELIDPVSKKSLGPVLTGPMHMFKLVHQVDKKLAVRPGMVLPGVTSESHYSKSTLQPLGGGHAGGQSIGSLGVYALLAHGSRSLLREMQSYKSEGPDMSRNEAKAWPTQHSQIWAAIQNGTPLPPPRPTFAFAKFENMLRAAGINVEKKGHDFVLGPLTDKHVLELSKGELKDPTQAVSAKLNKEGEPTPITHGLFDPHLTGGHGGRTWSHINLAEPVPNPIFEGPIKHLTGLTKNEYEDVVYGKRGVSASGKLVAVEMGTTGGAGIKLLLDRIDVKSGLQKAEADLKAAPPSGVDKALKKVKYLRALDQLGMKTPSEAYILHHLPILPPVFRPISVLEGSGDIKYDDINGLYRQFGQVNAQVKDPVLRVALSDKRKENLRKDLYDGVKAIMGVHIPYDAAPNKGLLHLISGATPKTGMFQDVLVSRRQDLTMRSTIVPDPALGLDEVGIPRHAALTLFAPFVVNKITQLGGAAHALEAQKKLAAAVKGAKDPIVAKALEKVMEERPVLLKRDPALHKYSVQAFKPKLTEGSVIKTHPLICPGFGADFDGDSVLGEVLIVTSERMRYKGCEEVPMPHTGNVLTFATIDLADFPRIEETKVVKESGVEEYAVPAGVCVPAYSGGRLELKPVSAYSIHPNCEEWEVHTKLGRSIMCSADHSLALLDPDTLEVVASPPREAEGRVVPTLRGLSGNPAQESFKGVAVKTRSVHPMMETVAADWDSGWFIGATAGDGWVTHIRHKFEGKFKEESNEQSRSVNLAFGKDGTEVATYWSHLAHTYANGATVSAVKLPTHEFDGSICTSSRFTCSSTALGLWVESLVGKGAENKHLPDGFITYPRKFREGLFCGLVDTDGSVGWSSGTANKKPQFLLAFSTISKRLADDIRLLGLSLGITSCVSTYINRDKPAYQVVFSTKLVQDARWIDLKYPKKAAALDRLRSGSIVDFGYNDFVPLTSKVREELLELMRKLGGSRKRDRNGPAFVVYGTLRKNPPVMTRELLDKVCDLCGHMQMSPYLEKWFNLVLDRSIGWDLVVNAAPTGERKTMYDLTVPDAWTFTMADGMVVWDTMSVYVPIAQDAIQEAHKMFPSNNLFSEASGSLVYQPTNESILGIYKLGTVGNKTTHQFTSPADAISAWKAGKIGHDSVVRIGGKESTPGRALLSSVFPAPMQQGILHSMDTKFSAKTVDKLLSEVARNHKADYGVVADKVKDLGFWTSTGLVKLPGTSDVIPVGAHTLSFKDFLADKESRNTALREAAHTISKIVANPSTTMAEKEHKSIGAWEAAGTKMRALHEVKVKQNPNNLFFMHEAGVKPKWEQYKQLALAPMLMQDSSGRVIPNPITKTYGEGLDIAEYWTHLHGARRGAVRKVQEVQEPGYLTKLMQSSASHLVVDSHDCGTTQGVALPITDPGVHDRYLMQDFRSGDLHVPSGTLLSSDVVGKIRSVDKGAQIVVRSPLRCESDKGVCATCAGLSADGVHHPIGTAIGVHAVHALGERAVQLTLKAFHSAGVTGGSAMTSSLDRLMQLTYLPSKIPNAATLATTGGTIEKVEKDSTGTRVWVGGAPHFVGKDALGHPLATHAPGVTATYHNDRLWQPPKVGDKVEAGQTLSDPTRTVVNPHDLYAATKSVEKLQNHLTNEIYNLYRDEGVKRKHVEILVKAMTAATRVKSPGSSTLLKGEVYPFTYVNKLNRELKDKVVHEPVIHGVEMLPHDLLTDWMAKMQPGTSRLRNTVLDAAATLGKSNIHGTHPIPALAYGAEFGLTSAHANKPGLEHLKDVPSYHY